MKVPIFSRKRNRIQWVLPLVLVTLLLFGSTVALASTEGGGTAVAPKDGWQRTPIGS